MKHPTNETTSLNQCLEKSLEMNQVIQGKSQKKARENHVFTRGQVNKMIATEVRKVKAVLKMEYEVRLQKEKAQLKLNYYELKGILDQALYEAQHALTEKLKEAD